MLVRDALFGLRTADDVSAFHEYAEHWAWLPEVKMTPATFVQRLTECYTYIGEPAEGDFDKLETWVRIPKKDVLQFGFEFIPPSIHKSDRYILEALKAKVIELEQEAESLGDSDTSYTIRHQALEYRHQYSEYLWLLIIQLRTKKSSLVHNPINQFPPTFARSAFNQINIGGMRYYHTSACVSVPETSYTFPRSVCGVIKDKIVELEALHAKLAVEDKHEEVEDLLMNIAGLHSVARHGTTSVFIRVQDK